VKKIVFAALVACVCFGFLAGMAGADMSVYVAYTYTPLIFTAHFDGYYTGGVYAGQYNLTYPVGVSNLSTIGYCIDLESSSPPESRLLTVAALSDAPIPNMTGQTAMGDSKAALLSQLWGQHHSEVTDANTAASFQLAVWEIVFETSGTLDVTKDSFTTSGGTQAQSWLDSLDPDGSKANLVALTNNGKQDVVVEVTGLAGGEVPAPSALLLCLIGMGFAGVARRIKRS